MKTAIASTGDNKQSIADERFGRCSYFYIYDSETRKEEIVKNVNKDMPSGVGVKVVEFLVEKGVNKVIAGEFGPKASNTLNKLGIEAQYLPGKNITVAKVIELLND